MLVVESAGVKAEKPRRRNYDKLLKEANTKNQRYLLAYEKHILKNGTPQEMEELKKLKKEKKRKYAPRKLTQEQRDGLVTDAISRYFTIDFVFAWWTIPCPLSGYYSSFQSC